MNLLLLEGDAISGLVFVSGRRHEHIVNVLGSRPGDVLRAGVINGPLGQAEVVAIHPDRTELRFSATGPPSPRPPVDLVLALPRPKALSRVLQTAAALGVGHVHLVNAWRVPKAYFSSSRIEPERMALDISLGCEQSGSTYLPTVSVHRLLVPFLEELDAAFYDARYLAHPRDAATIESIARPGTSIVAIGPEGGWVESELASFAALDFLRVSLCSGVLRSDAAVAVVLGQLALLARQQLAP
jgi:RsmE family RNA methyltransferase